MKVFGVKPCSRPGITTYHLALFHGYAYRSGKGGGYPFLDNNCRVPLVLTFNSKSKDCAIYPSALCFPFSVSVALAECSNLVFLPCDHSESFDLVVSRNSAWPTGIDASASERELLSGLKKTRCHGEPVFAELVPARLIKQPVGGRDSMKNFTFRRYLHDSEAERKSLNLPYFFEVGIIYTEGWYWITPKIWDSVRGLFDESFFQIQEGVVIG